MAFHLAMSWHPGEDKIHRLTGVEYHDNPTSPFLTPRREYLVQRFPLMAVGTLDSQSRPWTTIWGGEPPLAQAIAESVLGIRTKVDASFDPVVESIWKGRDDGKVIRESEHGKGRMISGLSINLEERNRVKLFGRMLTVGALRANQQGVEDEDGEKEDGLEEGGGAKGGEVTSSKLGKSGEIQLVVKIEQSLGNCPKYLNKKKITPAIPHPRLISSSIHLSQPALDLIEKADLFFISTAHKDEDMDTNIRGGPKGFIRVQQPEDDSAPSVVVWPEYSGNNLYQSLGNLMETPKAGLVIPDFESGDVLYMTGETQVLVGADAIKVIAKSTLAVKLTITGARLVKDGLAFRGTVPPEDGTHGLSPYNPRVRYLTSEKVEQFAKRSGGFESPVTAKLVKKTRITPTITRYRFALSNPAVFGPWKPGQHVALDFSNELDTGYSHMRDDDPRSLNDDYLRTFTVSSPPSSLVGTHGEEFELTVRNVGKVTGWLSRQREGRAEIQVRGFGGDFRFDQKDDRVIAFVAAGIGITPLLGQMAALKLDRLKLWWAVAVKDIGLISDIILDTYPALKDSTTIFLTGADSSIENEGDKKKLTAVLKSGLRVLRRRIHEADLTAADVKVDEWYLCTAPELRKLVQDWLPGKSVTYENYDY